jgi:hypothetical protein
MNNNNGLEVICISKPETSEPNEVYVGQVGLTIVNEFADLYLLRNGQGDEGLFPKSCFKTFAELNMVDYLDTISTEIADARFVAEKQGRNSLISELDRLNRELGGLRIEILEEQNEEID